VKAPRVDNLDGLPRYERPGCANCNGMAPECMVPMNVDGEEITVACCWVCAHMLTVHEAPFRAHATDCKCTAAEIYPPSVIAARKRRGMITGEVGGNVSAIGGEINEPVVEAKGDRSQVKRPYPGRTHDDARDARRARVLAMQKTSPISESLLRLVK
jgi:hypothetical protein